jgi:hypothetical protein
MEHAAALLGQLDWEIGMSGKASLSQTTVAFITAPSGAVTFILILIFLSPARACARKTKKTQLGRVVREPRRLPAVLSVEEVTGAEIVASRLAPDAKFGRNQLVRDKLINLTAGCLMKD